MKNSRIAWGLFGGLGIIYLIGLLLGWADRAPWHLLLVIVAILLLYNVFNMRK